MSGLEKRGQSPGAILMKDVMKDSLHPDCRFDRLDIAYVNRILNQGWEDDVDHPLVPEYWAKFVEIHHSYLAWLEKLAGEEFSPGSIVIWFGPADGRTYFGQEFRVMYEDKGYWDWLSTPGSWKTLDYSRRVRQIEKEWEAFNAKYPLVEKRLSKSIYFDEDAERYRKREAPSKQAYLYYIDDRAYDNLSKAGIFDTKKTVEKDADPKDIVQVGIKREAEDDDKKSKQALESPIESNFDQESSRKRKREITPKLEGEVVIKSEDTIISPAEMMLKRRASTDETVVSLIQPEIAGQVSDDQCSRQLRWQSNSPRPSILLSEGKDMQFPITPPPSTQRATASSHSKAAEREEGRQEEENSPPRKRMRTE